MNFLTGVCVGVASREATQEVDGKKHKTTNLYLGLVNPQKYSIFPEEVEVTRIKVKPENHPEGYVQHLNKLKGETVMAPVLVYPMSESNSSKVDVYYGLDNSQSVIKFTPTK